MARAALISFLLLLECVSASPFHARHATVIKRQEDLLRKYDVVVVGAGTAGLTVADRLSESGKYTVLVVEYGYLDHSPSITLVGQAPRDPALRDEYTAATRMYNITSTPQPWLDGRTKPVFCGSVVGGSSAVNGMLFDRGSAEDYDAMVWATEAADGTVNADYAAEWGWANLLPWFKKSVTFHPPSQNHIDTWGVTSDAEAAYGGNTPIHSSFAPYIWSTAKIMFEAYRSVPGVQFPVEHADGHAVGVFWIPNSIHPTARTRSYAMLGHYENAGGPHTRDNFHLLPGHRVTQIGLKETGSADRAWSAKSVVITPRDGELPATPLRIEVRREVVVAAGSFHTPQVLQRSGIGPRAVLEAAGVDVKVELPGVGMYLQDHPNLSMGFNFTKNAWPNPSTLTTNQTFRAEALAVWNANKTGPFSANVNTGAFLPLRVISNNTDSLLAAILATDPADYLPSGLDSTIVEGYRAQVRALVRQYNSTDSALLELPFSGQSSQSVVPLKPLSRGSVHLSPDDDWDGRGSVEPVVDYRTFSHPVDLDFAVEMIKFVRGFFTGPAMTEALGVVELTPGLVNVPLDDPDNAAAKAWIRRVISPTTGHPVGTAGLGPIEYGGVVGPDLRVHKVGKLSVADNSIMNILPGTHTSSSAYAIGEKAADLILKRLKAL